MLHNWCLKSDNNDAENIKALDEYIERVEKTADFHSGSVGFSTTAKVDKDYRSCKVAYYNDPHMDSFIWTQLQLANGHAFGFDIKLIQQVQYTIYESDEYEGGDLILEDDFFQNRPDPAEMRRKGAVFIFPSFIRHQVTPVTRGTRRSLVAWAEGPKFR